jgi:hypothetical protein
MNVNGFIISKLPDSADFMFAADNPKSGYGSKFYSLEAAIAWCLMQIACVGCGN